MQIRQYKNLDRNFWDKYVREHPASTFFHLSGWKALIEASFGHQAHYLIAESHHKIRGVFPIFSVKSFLFGRSLVSIPFATYGGILADDPSTEKELFHSAVKIARNQRLEYLEIRNENQSGINLIGKDLYYVFKKDISEDHEENLKAIPRKSRAMVRKAIKSKLEYRFGQHELLDSFYDMFAFNYHRLGTPVFAKKYLKNILDQFNNNCTLLIIYKDKEPLSGVLTFYYKDQVIPYYSGAYPLANRYAGNDFLYWVLMKHAADGGYREFDFGRSKKGTGPYHFKKHWGFKPRLLHYQYFLNTIKELPNISPANPKYAKRIEMWKKLPIGVTKVLGPTIVKYIP